MKIKIFLGICFLGILTIRCSKEEAEISCDEQELTEQYSDALVFDTGDEFHALLDSLLELPVTEQLEYSRGLNFESLLSLEYEALEKLDNATTNEEYENILSQYDIFEEEDSILSLKIANEYMAPLLNKYGIVIINGYVNKYTKDESLHCKVEDFDELLNYEINGVESDKVDVFKTRLQIATLRSTTTSCSGDEYEVSGSHGSYKAKLVVEILRDVTEIDDDTYRYDVNLHAIGRSYTKKTLGGWKVYTADGHVLDMASVRVKSTAGDVYKVIYTRTQDNWHHTQYTETLYTAYDNAENKENYWGEFIECSASYKFYELRNYPISIYCY